MKPAPRLLGEGKFGHRIEVKTNDELEELAGQFNSMAAQLQETYTDLEWKVKERTRDLAQSINELKVLEEVGRAVASSLDLNAAADGRRARRRNHPRRCRADLRFRRGERPLQPDRSHRHRQGRRGQPSRHRARRLHFGRGRAVRRADRDSNLHKAGDIPLRDVAVDAGFHSVLVVPLVDQTGVLGSLVVLRKNAGDFRST